MPSRDEILAEQNRLEVTACHGEVTAFWLSRQGAEAQWNGSLHYIDPHIVTVGSWMLADCLSEQGSSKRDWSYGRAAMHWPFRSVHLAWAEGQPITGQHLADAHQDLERAVRHGLRLIANPNISDAVTYLGGAVFMGLAARAQNTGTLILPAAPAFANGILGYESTYGVVAAGEETHLLRILSRARDLGNQPQIDLDTYAVNALCDTPPYLERYTRELEPLTRSHRARGALKIIARQMVAEYEGRLGSDGEALLAEAGAQTALAITEAFRFAAEYTPQPDS
ncbi:MAG TPA: hypothetical protein VLF71_03920 [Candidatus Saccharimonadales bacterium]|nr:hypothetical protein [Candidatus Saccharimonadales bacterium]